MKIPTLVSLIGTFTFTIAQQAVWGQCGGEGWTGATSCVSGASCVYSSPYYSQCVPGSSGATTSSSGASPTATSSAPSTSVTSISSYAKVASSGSVFVINGEETYFAGTNCYWCSFLTNGADVDLVFTHIAASGLKVVRIWGFNDVTSTPSAGNVWFQSFVPGSPVEINTGSDGLELLDYVVQSAEAHGISLIINFVNYWSDYGGMAAYQSYYSLSNINDWYNSSEAQAQYQTYIKAVVSRYQTSTAIFAWELANEPRCESCDASVINTWITTSAAYIKSIDSNHMVTLGGEGFGVAGGTNYTYQESAGGTNFTENLAVPDIDFGTYHLYPSSWGNSDSWGPSWIAAHATAAATVGKPVIAEEYGSDTHLNEASWQAEILNTNTAGDLFWQYGDTISTGETANDGYTVYYGTSEYTTLAINHAAAMNAKVVS